MQEKSTEQPPRPALLITVDTEGDNLWAHPREIATENARFLPRFQSLCEKYALKPTWLVNYEMAECPGFVEFARDILQRGTGEIGMHLHAWNAPPLAPVTDDDMYHQPYLIEYAEAVMRDKVSYMTDLLEDRFGRKMLSHRAGRWGLNADYARLLIEHGYLIDCSVTPHISWAEYLGHPNGPGGPDFTNFPEQPYFVDLKHIDRPGDTPLLEVPVSVIETRYARAALAACRPVHHYLEAWSNLASECLRRISLRYFPPILEMVPRDNGLTFRRMTAILHHALEHRRPCVVLAIHSSELMPGGSPFFPTAQSIEKLYNRLEILFSTAAEAFCGKTLGEFREEIGDWDLVKVGSGQWPVESAKPQAVSFEQSAISDQIST